MWYHEVFGTAYAVKIAVNDSMTILLRIITGVIQDADDNSYRRVVIVYVFLAAGSVLVGSLNFGLGYVKPAMTRLQWTRKERIQKGELIEEMRQEYEDGERGGRHRLISLACFGAVLTLILGAWVAYFWGIATGHNS